MNFGGLTFSVWYVELGQSGRNDAIRCDNRQVSLPSPVALQSRIS